jgi:hypothetical protein
MNVKIKLSPEAYEFLLLQVPEGSRVALEHAHLIRSRMNAQPLRYEFDCDDEFAASLLKFAQQYCPEVVPDIDFALRIAHEEKSPARRRGFFWG